MKIKEVLEMAKGINGLNLFSDIIDKDNDRIVTFYLDDMFFDENWNEIENDDVDWNKYEKLIDKLDKKAIRWGSYVIIYKVEDGFIKIDCASANI